MRRLFGGEAYRLTGYRIVFNRRFYFRALIFQGDVLILIYLPDKRTSPKIRGSLPPYLPKIEKD
ncbi:MAG: hypothetical protein LBJ00_12730 [Planctomycetaceae bacterium]|nr:hypothetical protein [Planctomycetaceae bacterium]